MTTLSVLQSPLPFPTDIAGLDGKLWAILTRGLRKDPADRTPTVRELRAALTGWLDRKTAPPEPGPRKPAPSAFETLIRKKLTEG